MSTLSPTEITYEETHIDESKQPVLYGVISAFFAIAILSIIARILSRTLQKQKLWYDDWLMLLSIVRISKSRGKRKIVTYARRDLVQLSPLAHTSVSRLPGRVTASR